MYDFTFLINGSTIVQITDSEFESAESRAKNIFGNKITKFELQSIYERS